MASAPILATPGGSSQLRTSQNGFASNLEAAQGPHRFGLSTLETVVSWTDELLQSRDANCHTQAILDVGTGNGALLLQLCDRGYTNLTGSDYSAASIALASKIASRRGVVSIHWVLDDFLHSSMTMKSVLASPVI